MFSNSFSVSSSGLPLEFSNSYILTEIQAVLINMKMPYGYKLENQRLYNLYISKKKALQDLKKFKGDDLSISEDKTTHKMNKSSHNENSQIFEEEKQNESLITLKDSNIRGTRINAGILTSEKKHIISERDELDFPSQFRPSNVISFSPIMADFSPYVGISPVGKFSSQNKIAVSQVQIQISKSQIKSNQKRNIKQDKEILEELKELKEKYKKLESQIKKINESRSKKTNIMKKDIKESPKRNKKSNKRAPNEEDKISLLNKIITLSVEDKKAMRAIIKDYITIKSDETFTFNLADLPRDIFNKLNKFVTTCIDEKYKKEVQVQVSTKENKGFNIIENKKVFKENTHPESTIDSDMNIDAKSVPKKRPLKYFSDSLSSTSDSMSDLDEGKIPPGEENKN